MSVLIETARAHHLFPAMLRRIGERTAKAEETVVLVPELMTLSTETQIMKGLSKKGLLYVDVLSPSHLYERVLEFAGKDDLEPLSESGKRMALAQALESFSDDKSDEESDKGLTYYRGMLRRKGFVEKLSALMTDMQRGGVTPEMLTEQADAIEKEAQNDSLRNKLCDLSKLYNAYQNLIDGRFSDGVDKMAYLGGRLQESDFFQKKALFVYGFDTLTDQLCHFLPDADRVCDEVVCYLICDDENASDAEIYEPVRISMRRLQELCPATIHWNRANEPRPGLAAPIARLENTLFTKSQLPLTQAEDGKAISISSGQTPYEEMVLVARQVRRLLELGETPEQITVLLPDDAAYRFAAAATLEDAEIPYFMDHKLSAASHGLVAFMLNALRAMESHWNNRYMFNVLRSGFAPLSFDECCCLENYAKTYGINRDLWVKPFERGENIQLYEEYRQKLVAPLMTAHEGLVRARTAAETMTAVYRLLVDVGAYETLQETEEKLLESDLYSRANQNSQMWQSVLSVLDEAVRISGERRIPLIHLASRLEAGFSAVNQSALPPASGMLHVGTLGHMLVQEAESVFILGLNDGALSRNTESLLLPEERADVEKRTETWLGLTDESRMQLARLDLKRAMTLPRKHLFLSYARTNISGEALRPLSLIGVLHSKEPVQMEGFFDDNSSVETVMSHSAQSSAGLPMADNQLLNAFSVVCTQSSEKETNAAKCMLEELKRRPTAHTALRRLCGMTAYDPQARVISKKCAAQLYPSRTVSVSRLEQFAKCPFAHFVRYGLKPAEVKAWEPNARDTGDYYHECMRAYSEAAVKSPSFPYWTEEEMDDCLEKVTDVPTAKMMEGPMGDNDRTRARMAQARRRLKKAVYTMTNQLARGDFKLYRSEVEFGEKDGQPTLTLILEDGERIRLRGKIDRVDRYDRNGETYYRVIDYKSSEHKLNPTAVWSGLQLQLLLYLDAICRTKQNAKPAGAFYFCIDDPVVDGVAPIDDAEAQKAAISIRNEVDKKLNLKGFVLRDPEICKAMDHKDDERNLVLPKIFNGKGPEFDRNAKVLDEDQMALLLEHTRDTAAHLAFELFSGRDDIRPTVEDDKRPCEWCDYKRICEIDSYHTIRPGETEKLNLASLCEALSEMQKNKQNANPAVK